MKAYADITGDSTNQPISMVGATYARAFDKVVGFGGLFPSEEDIYHQDNEYISIDFYFR